MQTAVEMKNITVQFGDVVANREVDFSAAWGEVHGLVGENGAGKTTLMRVLYGMYTHYTGELNINGQAVTFASPKDAIAKGIGMVHQHFSLVPTMTVAENIVIGKPPLRFGLLDFTQARKLVRELSAKYGLEISPDTLVRDLPVGLQQRVEILKALYLGADILIMDEPTAVLTPQEILQLMQTLTNLKEKGKCIILITHKLAEVKMVTDHITVMRAGVVTARVSTDTTDEKQIAKMMVGREVLLSVEKETFHPGKEVLAVSGLSCLDKLGIPAVRNISLSVRRGEVVGIAGVQGNGQSELAEAIAGLTPLTSGEVCIDGKKIAGKNPALQCRDIGMSHVHDDRMEVGASAELSIRDNFLAPLHRLEEFGRGWFIDYRKADQRVDESVEKFGVKIGKTSDAMGSLSGGNMQKLIISRELYTQPQLLIASQPTRGVDIGAQEFIYQQIIRQRDMGNGVLLISNELSEILALSDRILVIFKGEIIGELERAQADEETIGLLMAGIREDTAAKENEK